jgi:hypothetical protein
MLINDLNYFKRSSNYHKKFSEMDTPGNNILAMSVEDFHDYPIQDFDYQFNSWGFRGPEYKQYISNPVNICLGDSFTVNIGGPIEHSWCSKLAEHFDIPTINLGMDGAGNDAIKLVYNRACKLFDVQNTFVMYSFLHRRLINGEFRQEVYKDNENFEYFLEQRIPNVIECALPLWCWPEEEKQFLSNQGIYFLDVPWVLYFSDHQAIDRRFIVKESYNNLRGPDWPSFKEFVNGADPHPDMFTKQFGQFISHCVYTNRDGYHMNYNTNKEYADYLYTKWRKNNESQNT